MHTETKAVLFGGWGLGEWDSLWGRGGVYHNTDHTTHGWILASFRQNYHFKTQRKTIQHQHNTSICTNSRL